ncbi:hypothetical protein AVEN_137647-1 [Araneus ventricosus]|uniref:Uncharacterized protein n=1 Tax=Araneus ventricosus TaxID=182803 RepID=A0A4Y2K902_ARAVE|nr:hypothetical protein AVEN_137647-1 [Araneus ventricosus]
MVGKRVLQGYVWEWWRNRAIDPRPWRQTWRPIWRRNLGSQNYWNFLDVCIRGRASDLSRLFYMTLHPVRKSIKARSCCDETSVFEHLRCSENLFGYLFALRVGQMLDAERYCSCNYCYCSCFAVSGVINSCKCCVFLLPVLRVFRNIRE